MRTQADMYASQQRGVDHLYEHDETQFVAPMGYGKTVVAMTALSELIEDREIRCALIIAPKRVAEIVWPLEQKQWGHLGHLKISSVTGSRTKRFEKLCDPFADLYVIGIDNVPWLFEQLKDLPDDHRLFDCLVIDELSRLKSPRGVWSKKLRKISRRFRIRWGLTGTPRPNGYEDQFAPLSIISGEKLWGRSFDRWRNEHFVPLDFQRHNWAIRTDHVAQIEADIAKYTVTVDNSDIPELPPVVVRDHFVTLPQAARDAYDDMERHLVADISSGQVSAANMGVATVKLSQIAQGFLYADYDADPSAVERLHDEKIDKLEDLVTALDGDPVIVVYEFLEDLNRILDLWPGTPYFGHNTTSAQGAANERDWNAGRLPILAMHPAAAAHGLNLQHGGSQMIWLGMTWSPELYEQAIARIWRQGQMGHCFVHRILAAGTIDDAKVMRVETKCSAQEAFNATLRRV